MFVVIANGHLATFAFWAFLPVDDRNGRATVAVRRAVCSRGQGKQYQARTTAAAAASGTAPRRPRLGRVAYRLLTSAVVENVRSWDPLSDWRTCFA